MPTQTCDEPADQCLSDCEASSDADGDGADSILCGGVDCDDADPLRAPGRPEICDTLDRDEDCDPTTFGVRDADGDGFADEECCNSDGTTTACGEDCNDARSGVHPTATEACDGFDNDCDGATDELVMAAYYQDCDGDGYGALGAASTLACLLPGAAPSTCGTATMAGWSMTATDCDDGSRDVSPVGVEHCNAIDDDCDAATDEDVRVTSDCPSLPATTFACTDGACTIASCGAALGDCDLDPATGCEQNLTVSTSHCRACGTRCALDCLPSDGLGECDRISALSAGASHTCALMQSGRLACWGANGGALGTGTTASRGRPTLVASAESFLGVYCGSVHTCAITSVGDPICWGGNLGGQLGDGTTTDRLAPGSPVSLPFLRRHIAGGVDHSCAYVNGGRFMSCWGTNTFGQFGDGSTAPGPILPTVVDVTPSGTGWPVVAAGWYFTCIIVPGGVQCAGSNSSGQLGDGTRTNRATFTPVTGLPPGTPTSVGAGGDFACATVSGEVYCWGENGDGQLGDGTTTDSTLPVRVLGVSGVVALSVGESHACAIEPAGVLRCWGGNSYGQLGDGTITIRPAAVTVGGIGAALLVAAGLDHTCVVAFDPTFDGGALHCWGEGSAGQLGDDRFSSSRTPVRALALP